MDKLKHLRMQHNLLKDLVENTEKINTQHHDMDHDLLVLLKKEKLRIKDMISAEETQRAQDAIKKHSDNSEDL
jgi:DNA-binding FadR family transcriptional regulator